MEKSSSDLIAGEFTHFDLDRQDTTRYLVFSELSNNDPKERMVLGCEVGIGVIKERPVNFL